ncbi:hypothetical protein T4B_14797 [Trichinella pseudospiralis]|uniref:Uncharacterized protein n=1 Tax=Trichinella pseudospiralis TaxID=6337 RepID=A0A0V1IRW2_TRIPS|nr:hypothetical protein T4B_14797 [Trichinella pseudospiralis]KRZ37841.1 hypothetical protein T4C_10589 [Trichinella pseudospiralis]
MNNQEEELKLIWFELTDFADSSVKIKCICYDPNSNSNEQESAMANIVLDMIVHKNLQKADSPLAFKTEDAYYFYDIELAILGSNSSDYADYKSQTRQEYSRMSDEAYRTKRLSVLKTFLQIPNIFRTKLFSEEFEQNARRNICGEVEELSNQI